MESEHKKTMFSHVRVPIECAQCGEQLYMPEWSECLADGCVRHLWKCEVCDYSFETTIRVTETITVTSEDAPADGMESECA